MWESRSRESVILTYSADLIFLSFYIDQFSTSINDIENISTGINFSPDSDIGGDGSFSFSNLAAGTYCLSVDTSGSGSYSSITSSSQFTIVISNGDSVSKKFGFQKVID